MKKQLEITLEQARELYKKCSEMKDILISNFGKENLEEKILPKTWEDCIYLLCKEQKEAFCLGFNSEVRSFTIDKYCNSQAFKNTLLSKELAEAMLALSQLLLLRDYYNDGWEPDWTKYEDKYVIYFYDDEMRRCKFQYCNMPLAFKSEKLRDEFLENFKELIEQAKPLL
jgi:hypothetical protein